MSMSLRGDLSVQSKEDKDEDQLPGQYAFDLDGEIYEEEITDVRKTESSV